MQTRRIALKKDISVFLSLGEGQTVEFKEIMNEGVLKTISAFANTNGGTILIGISDQGKVLGYSLKDDEVENLVNRVVDSLGFQPDINIVSYEGRKIVKIDVEKSLIPIKYRGIYYKRVGSTTREMNTDELSRFFKRDLRWERLTKGKFNEDLLDRETIKNFVSLGLEKGRLTLTRKDLSIKELLIMLGLVEKGYLTNACILLFGKNPQEFFLNARVRVVRMKDNITIIGDRWISGNLFKQFYETEEAIKSQINVRYEIKGTLREDIWDYPLPAIREAVANAIVHRDYLEGRETQIKIYDDKIWFNNLGGLFEGVSLEELLSTHASRPRNPLIANVFYIAGIIESLGSGIERMRSALSIQGLPDLKIEADQNEFNLWFTKDKYTEEYLRSLGLNERQIKAVLYVKEKGKITNMEYRGLFNLSDEGARLDLKSLVEKNILIIKGKGRSLYYALK